MKLLLIELKKKAILAELNYSQSECDASEVKMKYEGRTLFAICRLDEITPEIAQSITGGFKQRAMDTLLSSIKNQYAESGLRNEGDAMVLYEGRAWGKTFQRLVYRRFDPTRTFLFIL